MWRFSRYPSSKRSCAWCLGRLLLTNLFAFSKPVALVLGFGMVHLDVSSFRCSRELQTLLFAGVVHERMGLPTCHAFGMSITNLIGIRGM